MLSNVVVVAMRGVDVPSRKKSAEVSGRSPMTQVQLSGCGFWTHCEEVGMRRRWMATRKCLLIVKILNPTCMRARS